jgi:hypothetical protein
MLPQALKSSLRALRAALVCCQQARLNHAFYPILSLPLPKGIVKSYAVTILCNQTCVRMCSNGYAHKDAQGRVKKVTNEIIAKFRFAGAWLLA